MPAHATASAPAPAVKLATLAEMKSRAERIAMLTAYDATLAAQFDAAGIDVVLVGDSLGMVVQGQATTLGVTLDHLVYHCQAVARGLRRALLLADLPFGSYPDPATAYRSAARLVGEGGAAMVKLERAGPVLDCIRYLAERDIPVCAHLGLTPQSVHRMGGYRVQARDADALVHAASGEGFPLAVQEAIAAGLPTVLAWDQGYDRILGRDVVLLVNLSGRGDKDVQSVEQRKRGQAHVPH